MKKPLITKTKRGDTIIEVMFAFAVFSLVAILSVAMMNAGVATSERSLELVVARNELNAQAEALRFIHSSYISELTLPKCNEPGLSPGAKCQQFDDLWATIVGNATDITTFDSNTDTPILSCNGDTSVKLKDAYANDNARLKSVHAFVLNVRELGTTLTNGKINSDNIYITSGEKNGPTNIFKPATLGARLIYSNIYNSFVGTDEYINSVQQGYNPSDYRNLVSAEGIWVVAIKGVNGNYYDFRIQTCWYGSGNVAPTTLDTVIRLNNPENL